MNSNHEGNDTSSVFATVLVARHQNVQPSALELTLRSNCQRLRVVESLSGAHVLLPSGDISLAVRAYFAEDCQRFADSSRQRQSVEYGDTASSDAMQTMVDWHEGLGLSADVDGLLAFRNSFKYSLVLMILDGEEQMRQLSQADSFFHRVQGIMNDGGRDRAESESQDKMARVVLVPNASSAMSVLTSIVDTLKPAKRERKARYYSQLRKKWFLPHDNNHNNMTETADTDHQSYSNFAAELTANAFREWATTKLPEGDENVILNVLGTLKAIVTANDQSLEDVPIDVRSQHMLQAFFGSRDDQQPQQQQQFPRLPLEFQGAPVGMEMGMMPLNHQAANFYVPQQQQQPTSIHLPNGVSSGPSFPSAAPPPMYAPPPRPQSFSRSAAAPRRQQQQRGFGGW